MTDVQVQLLHPLAVAPSYAHDGDAGADLVCVHDVHLAPGERTLVDTGIAIAIPRGWVGLVHPRSGLAAKRGLGIVNAPGTIDAGYRGEVKVCLINLDPGHTIDLPAGSRIAQLVIQRVERAEFPIVAELPEAERGVGGFGSTGITS
jgi:dUTP pyrophosphatase